MNEEERKRMEFLYDPDRDPHPERLFSDWDKALALWVLMVLGITTLIVLSIVGFVMAYAMITPDGIKSFDEAFITDLHEIPIK